MKLTKNNIPEVIDAMSLDDKLSLLVGGKSFCSLALPQYGITEISMCDSHNGINLMQKMVDIVQMVMAKAIQDTEFRVSKNELIAYLFDIGRALGGMSGQSRLLQGRITEEEYAAMPEAPRKFARKFVELLPEILPGGVCPTAFPSGMNMGSTWDRDMMRTCGQCVGEEAAAYDLDMLLAPTVNIQRDPRCGRWFESYSEDPYVMSEMVKPYIEGVQSTGVATTVKHFAANNQETSRHEVNEIISERALREIYLPAFKAAAIEAKSKALMTAYNTINGKACSANDFLLEQILRKEWGYEGMVVSDWNGVYDKIAALKAGNNLEMPGPDSQEKLKAAFKSGEITMENIDENIRRILELVVQTNRFNGRKSSGYNVKGHAEFSRRMAADSIVLLKNAANLLPLKKTSRLLVAGKYAKETCSCGTGSSGIISDYVVSVLEGLEKRFNSVIYSENLNDPAGADVIVVVLGGEIGEGSDRKDLYIGNEQKALVDRAISLGLPLIVALNTPGPVEIAPWIRDIDALLYLGYPGQEAGNAFADILSGDVNPNAKLTFTFPFHYIDAPTALNFPGEFNRHVYGEGIYIGYRYYDKKNVDVLFPFGYGLSYSDIQYKQIKVTDPEVNTDNGGKLFVDVLVRNNSDRIAKEVVELYIADEKSHVSRPVKELKGFKKVALAPQEEKWIHFELGEDAFSFFDEDLHKFVVEPGMMKVMVGGSSADLPLTTGFSVRCANPYATSIATPITEIMKNPQLVKALNDVLPKNFFEISGIQIELIFHPELSLGECIFKYIKNEYHLSDAEVDDYVQKVTKILKNI